MAVFATKTITKRIVMISKLNGTGQWLLRVSAALWLIWGLVHAFAGGMTIAQDTPQAVQAIADGTDPDQLNIDYPDAAGAIINQHGFNLLWIGVVTTICAVFVWHGSVVRKQLSGKKEKFTTTLSHQQRG